MSHIWGLHDTQAPLLTDFQQEFPFSPSLSTFGKLIHALVQAFQQHRRK